MPEDEDDDVVIAEPEIDPGPNEGERPEWLDTPGTIDRELMVADSDLFDIHLEGASVSDDGAEMGFLSAFLEHMRKVLEPLQVYSSGVIPKGNNLTRVNADTPLVSALMAPASIVVAFSLGRTERMILRDNARTDQSTLLSYRATGYLGQLLKVDPQRTDPVKALEPFGRRIGRSYGQLAKFLGENETELDWWSGHFREGEATVTVEEAKEIAYELVDRAIPRPREFETDGFLWGIQTRTEKREVRIDLDNRSIRATYGIPLTSKVMEAVSHIVKVRIREIEYFYSFENEPHRREWELLDIMSVGHSGGALAEQEKLPGIE